MTDDTYASPGTEKPQPENTDGVYSYAVTETKIGAQLKEREQQKQKPPPGDFYEEPNAAKNPEHKQGTITGEVYTEPEKPKRGTKKGKQQQPPVSHKEAPAGDLYAMPDKKKDVSHTTGPVTGEEYALASKPKVWQCNVALNSSFFNMCCILFALCVHRTCLYLCRYCRCVCIFLVCT